MALVRWQDRWRDPVDMFPAFPGIFNSFFENESTGFDSVPSVNVKETKDNYVLEVAAPGMSKDSFDLELNNNVLTISGRKEENKEERDKEEKWTRREFSYTSFQRSFQLPEAVKSEEIGAEYKDGVLMVKVPKKEETKMKASKRIEVK